MSFDLSEAGLASLHLLPLFPARGSSSWPDSSRAKLFSWIALARASRNRLRVKTGGSASLSTSILLNCFRVRRAEGVCSNSRTRVETVKPQTRRIFVTSWFLRVKPWARAAMRRAAAQMPAGRRPATIQSRFIRPTSRRAVRATALALSSRSRWAAKR